MMNQELLLTQINQVEGWLHRTTEGMRALVAPEEHRTAADRCNDTIDQAEMRASEMFAYLRQAAGHPPPIDSRLWPLTMAINELVEGMSASSVDLPVEQTQQAIMALHHARHSMASLIIHLQRSMAEVQSVTNRTKSATRRQ